MGLDMYAYSVPEDQAINDFGHLPCERTEIHYWRKHPNLHGFMETLWRRRLEHDWDAYVEVQQKVAAHRDTEKGEPVPEGEDANLDFTLDELLGDWGAFNGQAVRLDKHDLNLLKVMVEAGVLPHTQGFFFGESTGEPEEVQDDLKFVEDALAAIKEGKAVYYNSWW
jgi:hypothetical protein